MTAFPYAFLINFSSLKQDRVQVDILPDGIQMDIFPVEEISNHGTLDVYRLGLKTSSAKQLLRTLSYNQKYLTDDYQTMIWKHAGNLSFRLRMNNPGGGHYLVELGSEDSTTFIAALRWQTGDVPPALQPFTSIQDEHVSDLLLKGLASPDVLDDAEYWISYGNWVWTLGLTELSNQCALKALEIDPAHPIANLNLAVNFRLMGDHRAALEQIHKVPEGTHRRNIVFAQILASNGQSLEAVEYFEKAIQEEPDFYIPYIGLLDLLKELEHPAYEIWLEKSHDAIPSSPQITWYYCQSLLAQGRLEDLAALSWIDRLEVSKERSDIIGRGQEEPALIFEIGLYRSIALIFTFGNETELIGAIESLINADSKWKLCEFAKLLLHPSIELGNIGLVRKAYSRVCERCKLEERGVDRHLETALAKTYIRRNEFQQAIEQCEIVLNKQPEHQKTLTAYWWSLDKIGAVERAIEVAENLCQLYPDQENVYYNLGYLSGKNGRLGKARYYYLKEIDREPDHYSASENLSFICLQLQRYVEAQEHFNRCLNPKKIRVFGEMISEIDDDSLTAAINLYLRQKENKFLELAEYAIQIKDSSSYALLLQEKNKASEPLIGAEIAIGRKPFTLEDALESLSGHSSPAELEESRFQLEMQKRGDYSSLIFGLIQDIPNFNVLPESAKATLLEGEKRLSESMAGDFSLVVIAFSKAVEVSIKQLILEPFKQQFQYDLDADRFISIKLSRKIKGADKFLLYIEKGHYIGLGEMALVLQICTRPDAGSIPCFAELREYLLNDLGFGGLMNAETVEKIFNLARNYRNRAAHAATFSYSDAQLVRRLVSEIFATFINHKDLHGDLQCVH